MSKKDTKKNAMESNLQELSDADLDVVAGGTDDYVDIKFDPTADPYKIWTVEATIDIKDCQLCGIDEVTIWTCKYNAATADYRWKHPGLGNKDTLEVYTKNLINSPAKNHVIAS